MKSGIKSVIFFFALVILHIPACEEQMIPEAVTYEKEQSYKVRTTYSSNDNHLKFLINEVRDSRCPKNVWCVWQGEAVVQVVSELPEMDTIELSTYDNLSDSIGNYSFELIEVSPWPVYPDTIKQEDYEIKMTIKELGGRS
jgi:hypothetical protein